MKIDFVATRQKMKLIRITRWSALKGFPDATVRSVLTGKYPYPNGAKYRQVIDALRDDGYLVEVADNSVAA